MTKLPIKKRDLLAFLVIFCLSLVTPALASSKVGLSSDDDHLQKILSTEDARHLLMRTGVGARAADVVALRGLSRQQAINHIVNGLSIEPEIAMPNWVNRPLPHYHAQPNMDAEARQNFRKQRDAEMAELRQWWVLNILQTSSPQTERMVLFWHDLFATDYRSLGKQSLAMARQNQTFRALGFGSWESLLKAMIRDAALLEFLDAGSNHKVSPNENLARELMELFVLGEGNYDENTVREAARSLTGYGTNRLRNLEFQLKTGKQDRNAKTLFGKTGNFDGDDLIGILLKQEAAPRFLATRFWHAFVSDLEPDTSWIDHQANRFRDSDFDIATLYRNVLQSAAFWHLDNRGAVIKSPVDIVAGTARTLDYPKSQWQKMPMWLRQIGMNLFAPPSVAGWKEGAAFITPGHLLNRYRVIRHMTRQMAAKEDQGKSDAGMTPSAMQTMSSSSNQDVANSAMQTMSSSSNQDVVNQQTVDTRAVENKTRDEISSDRAENRLRASAIHMQRGAVNKNSENRLLQIILDHVHTPGKNFHHVSFTLQKKPGMPMTLKLDSLSCWPDCVEVWPECSQIDRNFTSSKSLSLPWVTTGDERWSSKYDHQCQFDSLNDNEKVLVSTLWAQLPDLLSQVKHTPRVQAKPERWVPVIEYLEEQYRQAPVQLVDTVYAPFAQLLEVSSRHAPSNTTPQGLPAPQTDVDDLHSLMEALRSENLSIDQLLLHPLTDDHMPDMPATDAEQPARYLKAVLENPLFQLK